MAERDPDFQADKVRIWVSERSGEESGEEDETMLSVNTELEETYESRIYPVLPQAATLRKTLSLEVARFTPPTVYRNSLYMNYVLVREIATLVDKREIVPLFARRVDRRPADDLDAIAASGPDEGCAGDRCAIAAWAERLDMTDWFDWMSVDGLKEFPEA